MLLEELFPFLNNLPEGVRELVINLILFVVALFIIWALRRVLSWVIIIPLRRLAGRSDNNLDDRVVDALVGPIRFIIVAIGLTITVNILNFGAEVQLIVETVARSILIAAAAYAVFKIIEVVAITPNTVLRFTGMTIPERLLPFVRTVTKVVIVLLAVVVIVQEWGFDVTALITSLGVVGLAIALAAQDTASNVFAFTAIVSDDPFVVGDFIKTPDVTGTIEQVGIRSTRVRQLDQALVTVPNSKLANAAVLNWSRLEKRRLNFTLGVTYDASVEQIRALLHHIREDLKSREVVDEESIVVHMVEFGASSLDILIICQIMLPVWGEFTAEKEDINLRIMEIVEELGMTIAYPTRSIHIENLPGISIPEQELTTEQQQMLRVPEGGEEAHQVEGTGDIDDQTGEDQIDD